MKLSKEDAAQNREAIVEAASRLFRERGYDAVGLNELMAAAGFTRGGFYNHFTSKEALATEVCRSAFGAHGGALVRELADAARQGNEDPLGTKLDEFLSAKHRDSAAIGCPSAALPFCAAQHGSDVQAAFAKGIEDYICTYAGELEAAVAGVDATGRSADERRALAIALLSQSVGAIVLARAIAKASPEMSDEVLAASKVAVKQLRAAPAARSAKAKLRSARSSKRA